MKANIVRILSSSSFSIQTPWRHLDSSRFCGPSSPHEGQRLILKAVKLERMCVIVNHRGQRSNCLSDTGSADQAVLIGAAGIFEDAACAFPYAVARSPGHVGPVPGRAGILPQCSLSIDSAARAFRAMLAFGRLTDHPAFTVRIVQILRCWDWCYYSFCVEKRPSVMSEVSC